MQTLRGVQQKHNLLRAEFNQLTLECRERELLLRDMRNALFTIRVNSQTLDENGAEPMAASIDTIINNQMKLERICNEAIGDQFVVDCPLYTKF
jgi:hypothetical protein